MLMKKTLLSLAIVLALGYSVSAQYVEPIIKPAIPQMFSPNAAELGKYGRTPVNYFNGLPSISIPLTEVNAKGYTLPIYLTYHASGNKPDQHPGWVGLGWTLHAGGSITRVINGQKDECSAEEYNYWGGSTTINPGYFNHMHQTQSEKNWNQSSTLASIAGVYESNDYEPDEFIIDVEGIQASFYFIGLDTIRIVSRSNADFDAHVDVVIQPSSQDIIVYPHPTNGNSLTANRFTYISGFTISDREGNKYHFGGDDSAIEYSITPKASYHYNNGTPVNNDNWQAAATANTWMLTRIERPDGEVITFSYTHDGFPLVEYDAHRGEAYTITQGQPMDGYSFDTRLNPTYRDNLSYYFLRPSYLTEIHCRVSGDNLSFSMAPTTELDYDIAEADFKYRVGDFSNYNGASFPFSGWKARSYYNQLTSIDGTGRHIALSFTADATRRLKLTGVLFKNGAGANAAVDHQYSFTYDSTQLPAYNAKKSDIWGYYNDIYYGNTLGSQLESLRVPVEAKMQAEILTGITYPTGGRTEFEYEAHSYSKVATQYPFLIDPVSTDQMAGGLRIKTITDYPKDGKTETRSFSYLQASGGRSSGVLSGNPKTYTSGHAHIHENVTVNPYFPNGVIDYDLDFVIYNENPIFPLSETDGNHVTYSRVVETFGDGSTTTYEYSNHDTSGYLDQEPSLTLGRSTGNTPYCRIQSKTLDRGLLLKMSHRSSGNDLLWEERYTYNNTTQDYFKSVAEESYCNGAFSVLSYMKKYCHYPALITKEVLDYRGGRSYYESNDYQYNSDRRQTSYTHTVQNDTDGTITYYPEDRNGGIYTAMIDAGMIGVPVGQATVRQGKIVSAKELTYKLIDVNTASGTASCPVPEAIYTAEFSSPVNKATYYANPSNYMSAPDITYLKYDEHANILGTETSDGIQTTYAWDDTALHPVLVARGVNPGQTVQQDVQRNVVYPLVYASNNSQYWSFTTSEPSTITFSVSAAYQYDWLVHMWVDNQSGYIVSANIPEYPPDTWQDYLDQYSSSIQFNLSAGSHTVSMAAIDFRKSPSANSNPAGSVSCSYKEYGTVVIPGETVTLIDFEDEANGTDGYKSAKSHNGAYTINYTVPSTRNYVVDYMLKENGAWNYHRESYTGGSKTLGASGKRIDNIRVFPADCDIATASYDDAGLMTSRTDARGVTESYEYDGLRRLVRVRDNNDNIVEDNAYDYADTGSTINSVETKTYISTGASGYRRTMNYLDGLGRPSQSVLVDGSGTGWDLVTHLEYDSSGREYKKWLPVPVRVVTGHSAGAYTNPGDILAKGDSVYTADNTYRYEEIIYAAYPEDRIAEQYGPGDAWRTSPAHRMQYLLATNSSTTSSAYYYRGFSITWSGNTSLTLSRQSAPSANTMRVEETKDEDGQRTLEFKDNFGQTVLVRQILDNSEFSDTYYVYDNFGRLAAVLPPEFVSQIGSTTSWNYNSLSDLAYLYRYDSRGNCIARSLPGAGWTYTVYDKGNRPVLTQDAALRIQNSNCWAFTLPDHLGRTAIRGTVNMSVSAFSDPYKSAVVKAALPKTPTYSGTYKGYVLSDITLSSPTLLEVDYYDGYGFAGTSPFPAANNTDFSYDSNIGTTFTSYYSPSAQGLPTGSLLKVLDNTTGNQYLWSVSYYDYRAQVVQHRVSTHLGGVEKDWFGYDFVGNVTAHKTEHMPSSGTSLIETMTQSYDLWGKPLVTTHQTGSGNAQTVSNKTYDKVGRLSSDSRNGNSALASSYEYNIRSWVKKISGTLFTEKLKYQNGATARWGGDISQQFWKDNRNSTYDSYSFTYDVMGRLLNASYTDHTNNSSVKFTENVTYDSSGNILSLERYGRTGSSSYGKIDNLAYTYSGNKLSSVKDTGSAGYSSDFRFSDGTNTTYSYTYDTAGRMTVDASKGITSITWNILSQPQTVTFSDGSTISYKYAADGTKLQEVKTGPSNTATTDYTGTLVKENGTNSRLLFGNGYVSLTDNAYHFFITDHLGSVRVVASSTGTAEEYNHYYPLGGLLPSSSSNIGDQPIKFQGKEWGAGNEVDLNLYDFGARRYDPSIGRWLSQDPLMEKYYYHTPYLFCAGSPINLIDPTGTDIYNFDEYGNYIGKKEQTGRHRIAVDSYDKKGNHKVSYYSFADPINDPVAIEAGEITNLKFLDESEILGLLNQQHTFDPEVNIAIFINSSSSLSLDNNYSFDYSSAILSILYGNGNNDGEIRSKYLFIPEGEKTAHNLMNLGNYLWAATGYSLGINIPILSIGAHAFSLGLLSKNNRKNKDFKPQLDSRDDQKSIFLGGFHAIKKGYRRKRQ